ncbi:TPA: hypothetical protein I7234_16075 [Vibrio vulnificus]|nr:hypothetical protein [Vibrio vulnificus]HAS6367575.1 hypothetical protein [Vibrio vulnificus]HDY7611435.1 hypothetical protein [Vibrio vulnificus]
MIDIYNPSDNPRLGERLGGKGLSITEDRRVSSAGTDIRRGIDSVEFPLRPCELSLVSLRIIKSSNLGLRISTTFISYLIMALNDDNRVLMSENATYQDSEVRTCTIHTIVVPKGATKIKVVNDRGFDNFWVRKYLEVSFHESTS